jgi:amidophosphoribosyltransferase
MLREAGAKEVHMRFSSPPFKWPCYYGIDIPTKDELLAANVEINEIAAIIGADSVGFLSLESLTEAIGADGKEFCSGCLTGRYPLEVVDLIESNLQLSESLESTAI